MKYRKIVTAKFLSRPNRFVANVLLDGREISVHVKNTGRCKELLIPDAEIYLEDFTEYPGKRKLLYDIVAVKKGELLINMDSQAPNKVIREALENGRIILPDMEKLSVIQPEKVYNNSRFDFYIEDKSGRKGFIEVKGVTLENDRIAAFPDAPSERGVKHLNELVNAVKNGFSAYAVFVIQMQGMRFFTTNDATHKEFGDALRNAVRNGVTALAYSCNVTPDSLEIVDSTNIRL